jgi:CDP-diacylglycerol--serine O-phosphatidyltransferase
MFLFSKNSDFNLANLITFLNIIAGLFAIYFISIGEYNLAVLSAWMGGVFDILDGKVARRYGLSSQFGIQLDSFADFFSFVIVPLILIYFVIFKDSNLSPLIFGIFFIFYAISGVRRLIIFNINSEEGSVKKSFTGIPTPLGAILLWFGLLFWQFEVVQSEIVIGVYMVVIGYFLNSKVKIFHL